MASLLYWMLKKQPALITSLNNFTSVMKKILLTALFIFTFSQINAQTLDFQIHEGELMGAPYKVAVPVHWEGGKVFFHVHGWRPADAPHQADLDLNDPLYRELLDEGWIIGRTAFQENGVDHDAHTSALYDLKNWILAEVGPIELLILEGESTAATLVLRIAEQHPDLADGVIAKSPFIEFQNRSADSFLEGTPAIPAILMSNLTELDGPIAYSAIAENAPVPPSLRPLLRPGHVNINWLERLEALRAIVSWIETGNISSVVDGTRRVPSRESGTITEESGIINTVTSVNPYFGNAIMGFHPDELRSIGINQGTSFILEVHGQQRDVFFGQSYGDVPHGEWIAFPFADDQILIARNHQSAIATANLKVGDSIKILPIQP